MANIKSFPNNQDEYVGAEDVMRWLHGRTSGVFGAEGNAAVAPVLDSMAVTVSDGNGWISNDNSDGVVWWIDNEAETGEKLQLSFEMADAVLPRIDRVVVSWQTTDYVALPEVSVLKGVPASAPVAPNLTNNTLLRQISLAAIRIPAGATAISADMITDERLDPAVCGIVTDSVSVDTSVANAQFMALLQRIRDSLEDVLGGQIADGSITTEKIANGAVTLEKTSGITAGAIGARPNTWMPTASDVGAVEMKKLWENASPGSEFAAQTISLDLSGYDYVAIEYRPLGTMATKTQFCHVGLTCHLDAVSGNSDGGMGGANVFSIWRQASVSNAGVAFTKAVYNKQNSTTVSITEKADYAIPHAIYGIKGVT